MAQPKKRVQWSPAVRQYVQRSFAPEAEIKGIPRSEVEAKLKKIITDAAESDNLDVVNWVDLPLPQQMIQEDRKRAILAAPPPLAWIQPPPPPSLPINPIVLSTSEPLRKRKSSELSSAPEGNNEQPPWRSSRNVLEDRVSFAPAPDKRQKVEHSKNQSKSHTNLEQRRKRFGNEIASPYSPTTGTSSREDSPATLARGPVIGQCQTLEKSYLRLTAPPKPEAVRPLEVLQKTLDLLKKKWKKESNYTYICDQFKSLRQDLTVQHIRNDFTLNVYEIHARIALEKGDLGEYNQCQTQLRTLYKQNLGGNPTEFKAYRILYFIHTCNRTDMNDVLSELTPADKADSAVKHALDVRSALALGNYHRFFQLYLETPNMGAYLMDMFVSRERLSALACICRA